jgi:DNA polymerase-4
MTGTRELFGEPLEMAESIRDAIFDATSLTASVGIAKNKFLAKLASDIDKPDGVTSVPRGEEAAFIAPMEMERIWGVGPKVAEQLRGLGLETIGDLAAMNEQTLAAEIGSYADTLVRLARGIDERPVVSESTQKSVGSERTFSTNIHGRAAVVPQLRSRCREVARALRHKELRAKGVRVKVRYDDTFALATRQTSLPVACDDSETLFESAVSRLSLLDLERPIRLVGAAAYDLGDQDDARQIDMFASDDAEETSKLEHTVDEIRQRFGEKIGRASDMTADLDSGDA